MRYTHERRAPMREDRGRDRGQTFVEILVSIVLLGTAVGGTLTALRATIVSSEVDEGRAEVQALLRGAEDALHHATYYSCADPGPGPDLVPGIDAAEIRAWYEAVIDGVPRPPGWGTDTIAISSLTFWRKSNGTEVWDPICPTDAQHRWSAQLLDVYVLSPGGTVGRTIQVVKGGD